MFVISVIALIIFLYIIYIKTNHARKLAANLPGDMDLPLIGNMHQLGLNTSDFLDRILGMLKKYNFDLYRLYIGPKLFVVISNPDDMQLILSNTKYEKPDIYGFLHPWLGNGLLTNTGEKWKNSRRIITPTFHFKILESFSEIMEKEGSRLVTKLSSVADGRVTDIWDLISMCTLDVISETAMGVSINAQEESESEIVKSIDNLCNIFMNRLLNPLKAPNFLFKFTTDAQTQKKALKTVNSFNDKVINKRRDYLEAQLAKEENSNGKIEQKKRIALLDMLITANIDGKPLTNKEISDEVSTFIFTGHDTVTSGLTFALYYLANNPEIQDKVLSEQVELLGTGLQKSASFQDLQNMKYLDLFIKESLRLCPSAPTFARVLSEDTDINGRMVPKGATIVIFAYGMHRNPQIFPNPEEFDPERFLTENRVNKHPYEYIPFSAGHRNCVGQKFAYLEMKSVLSKIVRNYELSSAGPENDIQPLMSVTLKSKNGVKICIKPREY